MLQFFQNLINLAFLIWLAVLTVKVLPLLTH